jgi:sorting nexin-29
VLTTTAHEVIGYKKKDTKKAWFDDECREMIRRKNEARMKMLQRETRNNTEAYKEMRRQANKTCRNKKKALMRAALEEIENLSKQNETRKLYAAVKRMTRGYQPRTIGCKDKDGHMLAEDSHVLQRWTEHFQGQLNPQAEDEDDPEIETEIPEQERQERNIQNEDDAEEAPAQEEIEEIMRKQKNNKAPGADGITIELIKHAGPEMAEQIGGLIRQIWREEEMPKQWKVGTLCPIHKKGDKTDCSNYRGIMLLSITYKILTGIINERLKKYTESIIGEYQCGFRKNRGTTDQLFIMRQIIEKCYEHDIDLHILFIDYKQAFDSVNRHKLKQTLKHYKIPEKLVNLIRMTLEETTAKMQIEHQTGEEFTYTKGVKQGDGLSTTLFILALHRVIQDVDKRGSIIYKSTQICAYADDVAIISRTENELKKLYENIEKSANKIGLYTNIKKTKYMRISRKGGKTNSDKLIIGDKEFEHVNTFKYLGFLIDNENRITSTIRERIQAGNKAYHANIQLLKNKLIGRELKLKIYKTLIRPIVTYGAEIWTLTKEDENNLRIFERKVIRKIFGPIKKNEEWEIRNNEEINEILRNKDIVRFIKAERIRWLGHVTRMEEDRLPKKILKEKVFATRKRGRPKLRWMDDVLKDLREMQVRGWREKARNREEWRRLVTEAKSHPGM